MATKIQVRRDTAANWLSSNPVLSQGEQGMEVDTGRVKYGDGMTDWKTLAYYGDVTGVPKDGVNSNPWRIVKVEGYKEFDYETPGHKKIHVPITSGMAGITNSATIDFTGQDIEGLLKSFNQESAVRVYLNDDRNWAEDSFPVASIVLVSGMTYTVTWYNNLTLNEGEELTIQYYVRGTEDTGYEYIEAYQYYPNVTAANTNQVVIDFDRQDGLSTQYRNDLISNATKSSIRFYASAGNMNDEIRNITKVTNEGDIYTITFDGAPMDLTTPTLETFTAVPGNAEYGNPTYQLWIDRAKYPQLVDCMDPNYGYGFGNGYGSGYIIFDKGTPGETNIPFNFYHYVDHNGLWELNLQSEYTITPTTTVEVHYYRAPDVIALYIYAPDQAGRYYGKKWFDWHNDMPQRYFNIPGNGVQGGTMNISCAVYDTLRGQDWYWENYPDVRFSTTGNYTFFNYTGNYFNESFPFDSREESGLYFWSAYTYWGESRKVKVRIVYSMELVVAEHYNSWYC